MKIMTLNAHSHGVDLPESIFQKNLDGLAECIIRQQIDVIALQEACQTREAEEVSREEIHGYVPVSGEAVIRRDNYVWQLLRRLEQKGYQYYWIWEGIKIGYGIFDEGLAIISKFPIEKAETYYLSDSRDYQNWKTRKAIAANIRAEGQRAWFACTHMGWWQDEDEPFARQMDRLQESLSGKTGDIYLMGDFNSPANERGKGYDYVKNYGWLDIWELAGNGGHPVTIPGKIDGWGDGAAKGLCIDYIWSKNPAEAVSSRIVFSGEQEPVISDHFGVLAEIRQQ